MKTLLIIVGVLVVLIVVIGLANMVRRIIRGDQELESGGSMGHQLTDPSKDPAPTEFE